MHDCYKGIVFPAGVAPLPDDYFSGTRIMAQSVGIEKKFETKGLYSFAVFKIDHHAWLKLKCNLDGAPTERLVPVYIAKSKGSCHANYIADKTNELARENSECFD